MPCEPTLYIRISSRPGRKWNHAEPTRGCLPIFMRIALFCRCFTSCAGAACDASSSIRGPRVISPTRASNSGSGRRSLVTAEAIQSVYMHEAGIPSVQSYEGHRLRMVLPAMSSSSSFVLGNMPT